MKGKVLGSVGLFFVGLGMLALLSCAGQRQEVVCDEIEYRNNSMAYSPDQRVFMEEELRACRAEEAKKKKEFDQTRQSIYARFAAQDTTKKDSSASGTIPAIDSVATVADSTAVVADSTATAADSVANSSVSAPSDSVPNVVPEGAPQE